MIAENYLTNHYNTFAKGFNEHDVRKTILEYSDSKPDYRTEAVFADLLAFSFQEAYNTSVSDWSFYYGPLCTWNMDDGSIQDVPSVDQIDSKVLQYWKRRSAEPINPVLRARYSDLVWCFTEHVTGQKPDYDIAVTYVECVISSIEAGYIKYSIFNFNKLKRALSTALSINKKALVQKLINVFINLEQRRENDDKSHVWDNSFDLLIANRRVELKAQQEQIIIEGLENSHNDHLEVKSSYLDIDALKGSCSRLASYYKKNKREDDRNQLLKVTGEAVKAYSKQLSPQYQSSIQKELIAFYKHYNLQNEYIAALKELPVIDSKVPEQLTEIKHTFRIEWKTIDETIEHHLQKKNLVECLESFAKDFTPIKNMQQKRLDENFKKNPILFLCRQEVLAGSGRVVSTVGSYNEDYDGNLILSTSENLTLEHVFIDRLVTRLLTEKDLQEEDVIDFLKRSSLVANDRLKFYSEGIKNFFEGNYCISTHLLVPQFEEAIRKLIEYLGGNVLRENRSGGYNLKTLDDLLSNDLLVEFFGEDTCWYFKILFTDQRGWNIRNKVCHGIMEYDDIDKVVATRVFHAILILGLVRRGK
jgi:hypothetical protein